MNGKGVTGYTSSVGGVSVGGASGAALTNGAGGSPLGRAAASPPAGGPSPMAALMSVADTLPPGSPRSAGGSPPQPPPQRSNSRSSQHSPNSSGDFLNSLTLILTIDYLTSRRALMTRSIDALLCVLLHIMLY